MAASPNPQGIQFRGEVRLQNIRGPWSSTVREGAFAIVWNGGRNKCWAYLHQFDPVSQDILINDCRRRVAYQQHDHRKKDWIA